MVRAGCVFVAGIHPSRTWTSGSFESVRWNACAHRLDLGLYSHPKEFWGNGVWTHVNSKGKIPSTEKCAQRSIEPTALWQRAQALPTELFRPPGNGVRTHVNSKGKIPSTREVFLREGSNPQRCIKQDSQPNTLPTSYSSPLTVHMTDPLRSGIWKDSHWSTNWSQDGQPLKC